MNDNKELKGWELKGTRYYVNGLLILALFNVLVLISEKPVPTDVWLWCNGVGLALFALGARLTRNVRQ